MIETFYDKMPIFIDREESIFGFSKESILDDKFVSQYEENRSKKKAETIRELNKRILEYTYRI